MSDNDPVAWAVIEADGTRISVHDNARHAAIVIEELAYDGMEAVPLYRSPTLTDEEREAVKWAIVAADLEKTETAGKFSAFVAERAATLRAMLERMK